MMENVTSSHAVKPGTAPTDLSTVTQNWDKKLPDDARFTVLSDFNNQAVRDNETGLVWERSPSTSQASWYDAVRACWLRQVGGRIGWHLPTIEDLSTLVDPSVPELAEKLRAAAGTARKPSLQEYIIHVLAFHVKDMERKGYTLTLKGKP